MKFLLLTVLLIFIGVCVTNAQPTPSSVMSFDLNSNYFEFNPNKTSGVILVGEMLYGTLPNTTLSSGGAIYRVGVNGGVPQTIYQLNGDRNKDGYGPVAPLLYSASDDFLYGSTLYGPRTGLLQSTGAGTIFRIKTDGGSPERLYVFDASGKEGLNPSYSLIEGPGNYLYGVTEYGGANNTGVIFRICRDGTGALCDGPERAFKVLYEFEPFLESTDIQKDGYAKNLSGAYPSGALLLASDQKMYGVTRHGGMNIYKETKQLDPNYLYKVGTGTIFSFDPAMYESSPEAAFKKVTDFDSLEEEITADSVITKIISQSGVFPSGGLTEVTFEASSGCAHIVGTTARGGGTPLLRGIGTIYKISVGTNCVNQEWSAFSFVSSKGYLPLGALVIRDDNRLYGVNSAGTEDSANGSVFSIDADLSESGYRTEFRFTEYYHPNSGLFNAPNYLFGTTSSGGGCGLGNVYRLNYNDTDKASDVTKCTVYTASNSGGGSMDKTSLWALLGLAALVLVRSRVFSFN